MATPGELTNTNGALALSPTSGEVGGDTESDTPDIETPEHQRSKPRWKKCRDLMIGIEAIRAGGTAYLPQHPNESNGRYERRRVIAALFNGYKRTILASVGLLVQQEPKLGEDMPQKLLAMAENVDGSGTHLAVFTQKLAKAGLVDGFAGVITEYPRANDPRIDRSKASLAAVRALETGAPLDAADEEALGLRPYFILVKADAVVEPIYETVNGKKTLVQLTIREIVTERNRLFGRKAVVRYRVYRLIGSQVYYERWTELDGKPVLDEGPSLMRNVTGIPWSPLPCGEEIAPNEYLPTLMDLADLNIEHHQIKTGILSLEDLACVPTPVRLGASPIRTESDGTPVYPDLTFGPGNTIEAPAIPGVSEPIYWLSPSVDVLTPAKESLENCKAEMGAMGASFLAPQPVQETAAAKRMDQSAETASIATVSRGLQDCLESAFAFAAQYIKETPGSVAVNQDFVGEGIDPAYLQVIVTAYQAGSVTLEELRYVLQNGKLPETFDSADVLELIANATAKEEQNKLDEEAKRLADAAARAA